MKDEDSDITQEIKDVAKVTTLLNNGEPLSKFHISGKTDILLETIVNKKIVLFNNILKRGFNIKDGEFLYLHHAIRTNDIRFVKRIIEEANGDLEYLNKEDQFTKNNALHVAIEKQVNIDIITLLSENNIDWNHQNKNKQTPLHLLFYNKKLLKDPNIMNLIKTITKINFDLQDLIGFSPRDIIKCYSLTKTWKKTELSKFFKDYLKSA
jgi:ankyrin repeat protein